MISNGRLLMDKRVLADQQKNTFISYVQTLETIYMAYQKWWLIGMNGERKLRECVLLANLDNDRLNNTLVSNNDDYILDK